MNIFMTGVVIPLRRGSELISLTLTTSIY